MPRYVPTGVVFAEVSARVEDYQRGRALGWVMTGQSLTLVLGVPLAAYVGSMIGWRGWNVCMEAYRRERYMRHGGIWRGVRILHRNFCRSNVEVSRLLRIDGVALCYSRVCRAPDLFI